MHRIACGEIWGGTLGQDLEVETAGIRASLFSSAADGARGGDVYYLSVCDNDLLTRILVADVTGHGAAVSRTSAWIYDSLRVAMSDPDGSRVLRRVNELAADQGAKAITTAAVAAFYRTESRLSFAYAGHHPVLARRPGESAWRALTVAERPGIANIPLGVLADADYDQDAVELPSGSVALIYSDGLIEARDASGEPFGSERLVSALSTIPEDDPDAIKKGVLARLLHHAEDALDQDDVTLIVFRAAGNP